MEIKRKANGLYCIDDISLESMVNLYTLSGLKVAEAEMLRGVELKNFKELITNFRNELDKAIWTSKKN